MARYEAARVNTDGDRDFTRAVDVALGVLARVDVEIQPTDEAGLIRGSPILFRNQGPSRFFARLSMSPRLISN